MHQCHEAPLLFGDDRIGDIYVRIEYGFDILGINVLAAGDTAESKIYQLTEGGRYNTQNDVVAQQLQFLIEPIKNWKTTIELNYRSNYNFSHTDYQTVYAYDVNKNPYAIANTTSGVTEYAYKSNFFNPNIFTEFFGCALAEPFGQSG